MPTLGRITGALERVEDGLDLQPVTADLTRLSSPPSVRRDARVREPG